MDRCPKCHITGVKWGTCPVYLIDKEDHVGAKIIHIVDSPDCLRRQLAAVTERELAAYGAFGKAMRERDDALAAVTAERDELRGYAQTLLLQTMHDISEASSCAQWLGDWAADLWACLLDPTRECGCFGGVLSHWTDVAELVQLARDAGCWYTSNDKGTVRIPLAEWEAAHGALPADVVDRHEAEAAKAEGGAK